MSTVHTISLIRTFVCKLDRAEKEEDEDWEADEDDIFPPHDESAHAHINLFFSMLSLIKYALITRTTYLECE